MPHILVVRYIRKTKVLSRPKKPKRPKCQRLLTNPYSPRIMPHIPVVRYVRKGAASTEITFCMETIFKATQTALETYLQRCLRFFTRVVILLASAGAPAGSQSAPPG